MLFVRTETLRVVGPIIAADPRGDQQMRRVHQRRVPFDELAVADLMTPLRPLDTVEFDPLRSTRVRTVIAAHEGQGAITCWQSKPTSSRRESALGRCIGHGIGIRHARAGLLLIHERNGRHACRRAARGA